jgi:chromosome segregation ATPase
MSAEKPARLIEKLLEQTKTDARRIKDLEAHLAAMNDEKHRAVDATAAFWQKRVEELKSQHASALAEQEATLEADRQLVVGEVRALTGRAVAAKEAHADVTKALTEARDHVSLLAVEKQRLEEQLAAALGRMADVEPRIALLEQQRTDLERLCDKVRDRMRRKELEEERAILNRKALAGAVPQRNWGR